MATLEPLNIRWLEPPIHLTAECPLCGRHITISRILNKAKTRRELQLEFEYHLESKHKQMAVTQH